MALKASGQDFDVGGGGGHVQRSLRAAEWGLPLCSYISASVTVPRATGRPVHNPSRFRRCARLTRSTRSALPSGVSLVQHLEQSGPRAPVWVMPQAGQTGRGAAGRRPAWRSRQRRWREALVGSGIRGVRQG
jgi:hypothetical protein